MDLLSRIAGWLGENEATISAVVGIAVLAGIVFAGLRSLVRRRAETSAEKAPGGTTETPAAADSTTPDLDPLTVPGFEGRPAIAVLPFDDLSSEHDQEYFADGIAEDLITRLSYQRVFPVIARNSSFTYKDKAVDVRQVGRELGARYVVEGSVRKVEDRVRISAQLIDATTGTHVWAENYDRQLRDVFAVQDEITEAISGSISPQVYKSEQDRAVHKPSQNLDAWDLYWRSWWHFKRYTKDDNAEARSLLERAVERDPSFARAYAVLAVLHHEAVLNQWSESPLQSVSQAEQAVGRAIALTDDDPMVQFALGYVRRLTGQLDEAVKAFERVLRLDPSFGFASCQLGLLLAVTGKPDDAIEKIETAIRLSPRDQFFYIFSFGMSLAHSAAGRWEEAVDWAQQSLRLESGFSPLYLVLAVSYSELGRLEEARSTVQELLRLNPTFTLTGLRLFMSGWDSAVAERSVENLRKAGLPE
jgi:TolB-like protein/Tfp pilus assembly protein PilF